MTEEVGIGFTTILAEGINDEIFCDFLKALRRSRKKAPIALFMDNLTVHTSTLAKDAYRDLDIEPIWNVPYSP